MAASGLTSPSTYYPFATEATRAPLSSSSDPVSHHGRHHAIRATRCPSPIRPRAHSPIPLGATFDEVAEETGEKHPSLVPSITGLGRQDALYGGRQLEHLVPVPLSNREC